MKTSTVSLESGSRSLVSMPIDSGFLLTLIQYSSSLSGDGSVLHPVHTSLSWPESDPFTSQILTTQDIIPDLELCQFSKT